MTIILEGETNMLKELLSVQTILLIIVVHYIADFLLQFSWMKSKKSQWSLEGLFSLVTHCALYAVVTAFCWKVAGLTYLSYTALFGLMFTTHFAVDSVTSKITGWLYNRKWYNAFFNTIGFDQVLHYVQLFLTLIYFTS